MVYMWVKMCRQFLWGTLSGIFLIVAFILGVAYTIYLVQKLRSKSSISRYHVENACTFFAKMYKYTIYCKCAYSIPSVVRCGVPVRDLKVWRNFECLMSNVTVTCDIDSRTKKNHNFHPLKWKSWMRWIYSQTKNRVTIQIGMFAFTGMNANMCDTLTNDYAIYLTKDERITSLERHEPYVSSSTPKHYTIRYKFWRFSRIGSCLRSLKSTWKILTDGVFKFL